MDIEDDAQRFADKVIKDSQKVQTNLLLDQECRKINLEIAGKIMGLKRKARTLARCSAILATLGPAFVLFSPVPLPYPEFCTACGAIALIASAICLVRVFQTEKQIEQLERVIEEDPLP